MSVTGYAGHNIKKISAEAITIRFPPDQTKAAAMHRFLSLQARLQQSRESQDFQSPATASNKQTRWAVVKGNDVLQHAAAISLGLLRSFKSLWLSKKLFSFTDRLHWTAFRVAACKGCYPNFISHSLIQRLRWAQFCTCIISSPIASPATASMGSVFDSSPFQALFGCNTRIKALHKDCTSSLRRILGFVCVGRSFNFKLLRS